MKRYLIVGLTLLLVIGGKAFGDSLNSTNNPWEDDCEFGGFKCEEPSFTQDQFDYFGINIGNGTWDFDVRRDRNGLVHCDPGPCRVYRDPVGGLMICDSPPSGQSRVCITIINHNSNSPEYVVPTDDPGVLCVSYSCSYP